MDYEVLLSRLFDKASADGRSWAVGKRTVLSSPSAASFSSSSSSSTTSSSLSSSLRSSGLGRKPSPAFTIDERGRPVLSNVSDLATQLRRSVQEVSRGFEAQVLLASPEPQLEEGRRRGWDKDEEGKGKEGSSGVAVLSEAFETFLRAEVLCSTCSSPNTKVRPRSATAGGEGETCELVCSTCGSTRLIHSSAP